MSKAKKRKREKMQRLREAGWVVGTADEFVGMLSVTEEQKALLDSLLETHKEFFANPTQETYEKSITAYRDITRPIRDLEGGPFDDLLNNKWCRRQLADQANKLIGLIHEHKLTHTKEK